MHDQINVLWNSNFQQTGSLLDTLFRPGIHGRKLVGLTENWRDQGPDCTRTFLIQLFDPQDYGRREAIFDTLMSCAFTDRILWIHVVRSYFDPVFIWLRPTSDPLALTIRKILVQKMDQKQVFFLFNTVNKPLSQTLLHQKRYLTVYHLKTKILFQKIGQNCRHFLPYLTTHILPHSWS